LVADQFFERLAGIRSILLRIWMLGLDRKSGGRKAPRQKRSAMLDPENRSEGRASLDKKMHSLLGTTALTPVHRRSASIPNGPWKRQTQGASDVNIGAQWQSPDIGLRASQILTECIRHIALAPDARRFDAFKEAAERLAQEVRNGSINRQTTIDRLYNAAEAYGLDQTEGIDTIQSALSAAMKQTAAGPAEQKQELVRRVRSMAEGDGLVALYAAKIKPRRIEWLWPGRIAVGKQSLIGGEPGLSKSQLICFLAATVSTGRDWPAGEGRAPLGNVIMLSAEDDPEDTLVPRLLAAGADLSRIIIVPAVRVSGGRRQRTFNIDQDLTALESKIREIGDVKLVTLDPISAYMGREFDSHNNTATRSILEPVSALASRLGVAVVSVTHSPKSQGTRAVHQFIGSVGSVAVVRAAFLVIRDPDDHDRRLFLVAKNNLGLDRKGLAYRVG
jgi:hypothetical protein